VWEAEQAVRILKVVCSFFSCERRERLRKECIIGLRMINWRWKRSEALLFVKSQSIAVVESFFADGKSEFSVFMDVFSPQKGGDAIFAPMPMM
jgi:hypothetical protein